MAKRTFRRQKPSRSYKKRFVIATEGSVTEPKYFMLLNSMFDAYIIHCVTSNKNSAPHSVLTRMKKYLESNVNKLSKNDQAWLVIDKDCWSDEQLDKLLQWTKEKKNHHLAVSNPNFEYWLLLHFENCKKITTGKTCNKRLKKHITGYKKNVPESVITQGRIQQAVQRARQRDQPSCSDWPRITGTTVYRLVEQLCPEFMTISS